MKIIITHQSNSISFEIEENLPEHEAFEVLRAFTVSAFENLPDPLVYSLSAAAEPFLLQDPKDWKEGKQKHFRGSVICLTIVDSAEADSDETDSYVHITDSGAEKAATESTKPEEGLPEPDEAVIEDYDEEAGLDDKDTDEEEVEAKAEAGTEPPASPESMCKRIKQFIVEIGAESLQNIAAVVFSLVTEGNVDLSDAIRTAVETSEKAANHPLTQDLLAILDVYVQKFQKQCNWHSMLSQFNIDQIVALIPGIVDALTRSMEGASDVTLDLAPLMLQFCPMLANMQRCMPPGEVREFPVNPMNPFAVFQQAREQLTREFPEGANSSHVPAENAPVHRGITCDGCEQCPIIGVRYKSILRADYDLCEACEKDHNPEDPLIKIKTPVEDMDDMLPGLSEFRRQFGGRGRRCPRRWGRGRGRGCPRRGRRHCGPRNFHRMFHSMRERFCQSPPSGADHRDAAREDASPVAAKQAEVEKKKQEVRAAKAQVKALKKQAKACRKELKKAKKQEKKECKMLDAAVTGHLDLEEKSVQKAGASALKTWKVKNTGSMPWPEDTIAIFHNGNQSLVETGYELIPVGTVQPGDVQYIRCMLSIPEVEGTYSVGYRLSGPQGKFGGRLMTEVEVVADDEPAEKQTEEEELEEVYEQPQLFQKPVGKDIPEIIDLEEEESSTAQVSEPQEIAPEAVAPKRAPEKSFQFQQQKDQIKTMGFTTDDETVESVLVACKGDIGQAIELLM